MTTTAIVDKKRITNVPTQLSVGKTSGYFTMSIPFVAEYIMILNDTEATIAVCNGEQYEQGQDAQIWTPGSYFSVPLVDATQKVTVFWTSQQPISADNNLVQVYFSNVTIPLQGGKFGAAAESQNVDVLNTVTVQFAATQNVNVETMPVMMGTDGTNKHQLLTDANGVLNTNIETMPSIPEGTAVIGKVDLNSTNQLIQGISAGPVSANQVTVDIAAIDLVNGVVNGKKIKIKNIDATNSIFIGGSTVTGTTGYELFPKDTLDLDVVPGSTIAIYGIATAGSPIASVLILN